jgi:hypothetical protein
MTMNFKILAGVLAVFVGGFGAVAQAAEPIAVLGEVQGKVLINQGDGYEPGVSGLALLPNAKLMVGAESTALVSYNSCAVVLNESSMHVVSKTAPCAPGQKTAMIDGLFVEPASVSCSAGGAAGEDAKCNEARQAKNSSVRGSGRSYTQTAANIGMITFGGIWAIGVYYVVWKDDPVSTN